jgi:hypothetical protein
MALASVQVYFLQESVVRYQESGISGQRILIDDLDQSVEDATPDAR